jgi:NAD(P)-dependent dehydrogenase (short-subunit alcohol dehydrogenase family)
MECKDRVALVTGASGKGIGRSIALTLAREGAKIAVNYRSKEKEAYEIAEYINHNNGLAIPIKADVFTKDGCNELVEMTRKQLGSIEICIIGPGAGWHPGPVDKLNPDDALEDMNHEISPIYYLLPRILPDMYQRKWGRVIGISSNLSKPSPAYSYNAGKAGRTHALLLAKDQAWAHRVTINVIAPGPFAAIDDYSRALHMSLRGEDWKTRKNLSPQDIAEGVAFLCSDSGRYITGNIFEYAFE